MDEWAMFERYVDFTAALKPQHLFIEQQVLSPILGFAGTIDRVCEIDGKKYVLDIKTSNGIYNSYWLQIAAYQMALLKEAKVKTDGVAILWLNAKTRTKKDMQGIGWQLVTKEDTTKDWNLFRSVQKLWLAEHSEDKPKQFSYTLSHKK
jgi:predicted RecB family nuclease